MQECRSSPAHDSVPCLLLLAVRVYLTCTARGCTAQMKHYNVKGLNMQLESVYPALGMSHFLHRSLIVNGGLGDLLCMLLFPRCTAALRLALRSMPMHNLLPSLAQGVICCLTLYLCCSRTQTHVLPRAPLPLPCLQMPRLACHYPATCDANCPPSPTLACR